MAVTMQLLGMEMKNPWSLPLAAEGPGPGVFGFLPSSWGMSWRSHSSPREHDTYTLVHSGLYFPALLTPLLLCYGNSCSHTFTCLWKSGLLLQPDAFENSLGILTLPFLP